MRYGSVCSGIEAATVAWHPFGWEPVWFSEIEPFPCKVLKHHYPNVPNLGDMLKLTENETFNNEPIDLLVGGTPCQSFSIAGLRAGLADQRGNLALEYCRILIVKQPKWFVWENVPGALSSFSYEEGSDRMDRMGRDRGREFTETADFATILQAFRQCGYSCAYRVLDAQYFGVPQRRRRVFVVGYLGDDWRPPAAVLFEPQSLRRDIKKGGKEGKRTAAALTGRAYADNASGQDNLIAKPLNTSAYRDDYDSENFVTHTLVGKGHDASEDGTGRGIPLIFQHKQSSAGSMNPSDLCPTLHKGKNPAVFRESGQGYWMEDEKTGPLRAEGENRPSRPSHVIPSQVRRLTPMECERLQGFPDQYTGIKGAKNSPRYSAIGNSMATKVMRWIGRRIDLVDKQMKNL